MSKLIDCYRILTSKSYFLATSDSEKIEFSVRFLTDFIPKICAHNSRIDFITDNLSNETLEKIGIKKTNGWKVVITKDGMKNEEMEYDPLHTH